MVRIKISCDVIAPSQKCPILKTTDEDRARMEVWIQEYEERKTREMVDIIIIKIKIGANLLFFKYDKDFK